MCEIIHSIISLNLSSNVLSLISLFIAVSDMLDFDSCRAVVYLFEVLIEAPNSIVSQRTFQFCSPQTFLELNH